MWHWDQGRLAYFQFDALRQIATFVVLHDFKEASKATLFEATGLSFSAPQSHSPWRNYSRILKLCLLVSEIDGRAQPTPVADILSNPGSVTCDEYLHFLLCAFTEPAPALQDWRPDANFRYPLLFALKYLLAKTAIMKNPITGFDEIIGAYQASNFDGTEDDSQFICIINSNENYEEIGKKTPDNLRRQARESLRVIAQISYLHTIDKNIIVSLSTEDARDIFSELCPILGPRSTDQESEIRRLATLFKSGSTNNFFDYPNTIVNEVVESGFREGSKIKKTHVTIERNAGLRKAFFQKRPTTICDVCMLDTAKTYPWTERVMDIHHLLPLSSGTRVEANGTTFADLVPVCPSCHRAIHRFYDEWLNRNSRKDFKNSDEAHNVYREMKSIFPGLIYAYKNS